MGDPEELRRDGSRARLTAEAVRGMTKLAGQLGARGLAPLEVASFVHRLLVCMLAEGAQLLAPGSMRRVLGEGAIDRAAEGLRGLFKEMRGWLGDGLFSEERVVPLSSEDMEVLWAMMDIEWSAVEPAILGAVFERGLDPGKRSQLGAHYTDRGSILRIIEPVVMGPLRAEFVAMQAQASAGGTAEVGRLVRGLLARLRGVRVLDPACGSGNFLYVALQVLRDLEEEVIVWGARRSDSPRELSGVGAQVVCGLELHGYAAELARVTVWLGELQWMRGRGLAGSPGVFATIEHRDALLDSEEGAPRRAQWPEAEFIVGNPPFLGGKKLRAELGDGYVERLFRAWEGAVPREADLAVYWHEKAREMIAGGRCKRAGLLATQAIRGGANLEVLRRIKASGDIFLGWSNEPWMVDGAAVRVSMVGQDDGSERERRLDGALVAVIHADLSGGVRRLVDLTGARRLQENLGVAFMGDTKGGSFQMDGARAAVLLGAAVNANGRANADVVVPWVNGLDVTRRARGRYIVDFGVDMPMSEAALYVLPFEHVRREVEPVRAGNRRARYRERWWLHVEARPGLRAAIEPLARFIVTPTVARHRLFVWLRAPTLPDHQLIVLARADAYCFGVVHSRVHALWSLRMCTWLGAGNDPRYTPTTTFETFPFPWPLDLGDALLTQRQRAQREAIAGAAESLDGLREGWLNAVEVSAEERGRRTLSRLYHAKPGWLVEAHARLDAAVLAAYGWGDIDDDALLGRLLALNYARPAARSRVKGSGGC